MAPSPMIVEEARAAAADWVARHARHEDGFRGAFIAGSTVWLPGDAEMPPTSDVDVMVVTESPPDGHKLGKFRHHGGLLEVTHLPGELFATAEGVLGSYHLATSFRVDTVIEDPTGELRRLQTDVARRIAERAWVRRRCADAYQGVRGRLARLAESPEAPLHEQVTAWLFATGVTTHVLRGRRAAQPDGPAALPRGTRCAGVLRAARRLSGAAGPAGLHRAVPRTGRPALRRPRPHVRRRRAGRPDPVLLQRRHHSTPQARPIAIDGCRELIDRGERSRAASPAAAIS